MLDEASDEYILEELSKFGQDVMSVLMRKLKTKYSILKKNSHSKPTRISFIPTY